MENTSLDTNLDTKQNIENLDNKNKTNHQNLDLTLEKNYQQIEDEILEEARIKNEKEKINRELLNQIKIIKKAEALLLKEKQKLVKLTMKKEAL